MVQLLPASPQKPEYPSGDTAWGLRTKHGENKSATPVPVCAVGTIISWQLPVTAGLTRREAKWEGVWHGSVRVGLMIGGLQWGKASSMFWHHEQHGGRARSRMQKRDQALEVKQPLCSM